MNLGCWGWVWEQCFAKRRPAVVVEAVIAVAISGVELVAIVSLTELTLVVAGGGLLMTVVVEVGRVGPKSSWKRWSQNFLILVDPQNSLGILYFIKTCIPDLHRRPTSSRIQISFMG